MPSIKRMVARVLLGDLLPQEFTVSMPSPQNEIAVWLCGSGIRRDITYLHSTACSDPFVLCIRLQDEEHTVADKLWLEYAERDGGREVLGKIGLKVAAGIQALGNGLHLFEARTAQNLCLTRLQAGIHNLLQAYQSMLRSTPPDMNMTVLEQRAAIVTFIRPHPIGIGSVDDIAGGNIFILNLMGELGNGRFGLGLKNSRWPAHLVERTGRMALSSVPASEGRIAFFLTRTHIVEHADWGALPFGVRLSTQFKIRVPEFSLRVRELEVEDIRKMGSHNFFVMRVTSDEHWGEGSELHALHGTYQARRLRGQAEALRIAIAYDKENKRGRSLQI